MSATESTRTGWRRWRGVIVVVGVLLAYALPLLRPPFITTPDSDFAGVMVVAASYALVALGLNIVIGYAGLLDLGYVGFYAAGAYTTGVLTSQHWHWPYFFTLPVAIAVTMVRHCRKKPSRPAVTMQLTPPQSGHCTRSR